MQGRLGEQGDQQQAEAAEQAVGRARQGVWLPRPGRRELRSLFLFPLLLLRLFLLPLILLLAVALGQIAVGHLLTARPKSGQPADGILR